MRAQIAGAQVDGAIQDVEGEVIPIHRISEHWKWGLGLE